MISSKTRRKVDAARTLYIERRQPSPGVYLGYFRAAVEQTPESVIRRLSAVELCDLVESIELGWKHSRNLEREDILSEGAIWDGQKMREIA